MSGMTVGQAAYEAWWATAEGVPAPPDVTYDQDAEAWEAAAQAAIDTAIRASAKRVAELGWIPPAGLAAVTAERDSLREQLDELRVVRDEYRSNAILHTRERDEARGQLAQLRTRLGTLAAALEQSAQASHPSRKSEIERETARRIRGIVNGAGQ